ncbi:MAG: hypothetical protein ABUT11_00975, partial [Leifsonia sp.]
MSALSTLRSSTLRRVGLALSAGTALVAVAALTGCSVPASHSGSPAHSATSIDASSTGKNFSVVLNVQNNSTY